MKKRPIILAIILLLAISGFVISGYIHLKEPPAKLAVESKTDYEVYDCVDENGEIDIVVEFATEKEQELYAQYCARIVLDVIKHIPRQSKDMPKEVTVRLYNKRLRQVVLRVSVKGKRFLETPWDTLYQDQIPDNVDYYYFNSTLSSQ